jgi:hypothetical protein
MRTGRLILQAVVMSVSVCSGQVQIERPSADDPYLTLLFLEVEHNMAKELVKLRYSDPLLADRQEQSRATMIGVTVVELRAISSAYVRTKPTLDAIEQEVSKYLLSLRSTGQRAQPTALARYEERRRAAISAAADFLTATISEEGSSALKQYIRTEFRERVVRRPLR